MSRRMYVGLLLSLVACEGDLSGGFAPEAGALVRDADAQSIYVPDADNGALARVNTRTGETLRVLIGREPTRAVRIDDTVYVTLRAERAVAVVHVASNGTMELQGTIPVGAEPYGIAASPDGAFLYVVCSMEDAVFEVALSDQKVSRRFPVPGEPRWIGVHPSGNYAYVGSVRGGLFRVDLREGDVSSVPLPVQERGIPGRGRDEGQIVSLTPRVTGDPVIDSSGEALAVPVLYADNSTSAGAMDPSSSDPSNEPPISDPSVPQDAGYSGEVTEGVSRFNPAVMTMMLASDGDSTDDVAVQLIAGQSAVLGGVPEVDVESLRDDAAATEADVDLLSSEAQPIQQVRGYITNLAFSPNGRFIAATLEGNRTVAMVPTHPVSGGRPETRPGDIFFGSGGFDVSSRVMIGVEDGPTGVVFLDDQTAVGWSFLSRTLAKLNAGLAEQGFDLMVSTPDVRQQLTWSAESPWRLEPSILPPDVLAGRHLFYSATESSMAAAGAGVTCATCHFEGRNDGLTWTFDEGVRQTPSLAGPVSATSPVTWTNNVPSTAREAELTSQGRMGGNGITAGQKADIAAYIDWSRDVDVPLRGASDAAITRGKALFESAATACSSCHNGDRFTDNRSHDMVGLVAVNTPGLVGVAASAPYLHDGRAATLEELVDMADEVGMGSTASLSAEQRADLVAYLRSL